MTREALCGPTRAFAKESTLFQRTLSLSHDLNSQSKASLEVGRGMVRRIRGVVGDLG